MSEEKRDSAPGKVIDVDQIDLDLLKKQTVENPGLTPFSHTRGGQAFAPTKAGAIKGRAYKVMDEQIEMQMDNILEQIQVLAKQAEALKVRREISEKIYESKMNFEPLIGDCYYLYKTPSGNILSMLTPEDWGADSLKRKNYQFVAKAKLLADCTWEVLEGEFDLITST